MVDAHAKSLNNTSRYGTVRVYRVLSTYTDFLSTFRTYYCSKFPFIHMNVQMNYIIPLLFADKSINLSIVSTVGNNHA